MSHWFYLISCKGYLSVEFYFLMIFVDKLSPYEPRRVVLLGFVVVLALVLVYASTSLYLIRQSTNDLTKIVEINTAKITHLYTLRDVVRQRQIILNTMLSSNDPFIRDEMSLEFFSIAGEFRETREKLEELVNSPQERELLKGLVKLIRVSQPINRAAVSSMKESFNSEKSRLLSQQAQLAQADIVKVMDELADLQIKDELAVLSESKQAYESVFFWSVLSVIFLILLTATISRLVIRFVSQKNAELILKNSELEDVSKLALEATRTKSTFLATMSHEIRTPLTAIIGFAEMNLHDSIPQEDKSSYSQSIVKNGKHLLHVINDILDISKLEADRIEFENEKFSPFQVINEVEQVIASEVKQKGLILEIKYEYPIPEYIMGDELRFKQVVLNLCSNAVKFTEFGRISINVGCDFSAQKLYVEVEDTGIGLKEEQLENVFEAFTQADSTVTRKYGGTGLGLALCKQFVEKMGGEIEAHSIYAAGSRFIIKINTGELSSVNKITNLAETNGVLTPESDNKLVIKKLAGKILLAEDNLENQRLFGLLLRQFGADLTIVENGQQAVEAIAKQVFDLVFMDMQMPVMGGVEATKKIRSSGYSGAIVSLTANAMKQDKEACINAGCNDYLTKPVSKKRLYDTVYKYLTVVDDVASNEDDQIENSEGMRKIKRKFLTSLPVKLLLIKNNFEQKCFKEVESEVHKLKGLGGAFGFPEITNVSRKIELALENNNIDECNRLIDELELLVRLAEG